MKFLSTWLRNIAAHYNRDSTSVLNEVPEHMAQEFLFLFPWLLYGIFLNEVPEHMAQE